MTGSRGKVTLAEAVEASAASDRTCRSTRSVLWRQGRKQRHSIGRKLLVDRWGDDVWRRERSCGSDASFHQRLLVSSAKLEPTSYLEAYSQHRSLCAASGKVYELSILCGRARTAAHRPHLSAPLFSSLSRPHLVSPSSSPSDLQNAMSFADAGSSAGSSSSSGDAAVGRDWVSASRKATRRVARVVEELMGRKIVAVDRLGQPGDEAWRESATDFARTCRGSK